MSKRVRNIGAVIVDSLRREFIEKAFKSLGTKDFLLDLGCGNKPYKNIYEGFFKDSVGADIYDSPHGLDKTDIIINSETLPFEDSVFDVVLCTEVMEHVKEPETFLREIHRVLKPGGSLIMTTPFLVSIHEQPNDFYRYTIFGLRYLFEKTGYRIVKDEYFSEMFGVLISFIIQPQLKFWYLISRSIRMKIIYSNYNPILFIFIYLPQLVYIFTIKELKRSSTANRLLNKLSYVTQGYGVVAVK